ncbi:MAG: hypothetical protein U1E65_00020 [Myxococcota bacterium]
MLAGAVAACSPKEEPPPFDGWTLESLTGTDGFSIRVGEGALKPGEESQNCYFMHVPDINNGGPVWMTRVKIAANPGTHHINVFRVKTVIDLDPTKGEPMKIGDYDATLVRGYADFAGNPCWHSANWADWPLVANSQHSNPLDPYTDWKLPTDVGIKFEPGEMIMIQTHYVNLGKQLTPYGAQVGINFYQSNPKPTVEMGSLFATQQSIRICQSTPTAKFSGTCRFPKGQVTIAATNGHFHSRGKKFEVFAWDGKSAEQPAAPFYTSNAWDDPPMARDLDVKPPDGGGVWWNCSYQWVPPTVDSCNDVNAKDPLKQGDCCYTFGGNVDVGEHCNLFLYYYPRVDNSDVFCL